MRSGRVPVRSVLVLLACLVAAATAATASSPTPLSAVSRLLQEDGREGNDNNNNYYSNMNNNNMKNYNYNIYREGQEQEGGNNNNEDGGGGEANFLSRFMDRIDGDVDTMWTSSPSEWVTEYWEVLAAFLGVSFLMAMFVCYVFCVVPCSDGGGGAGHDAGEDGLMVDRTEMTQAELDAHKRGKRQRSRLLSKMRGAKQEGGGGGGGDKAAEDWESPFVLMTDADGKEVQQPASALLLLADTEVTKSPTARARDDLLSDADDDDPAAAAAGAAATGADDTMTSHSSLIKQNGSRDRARSPGWTGQAALLWNETVDVWSEFLGFHRGPRLTPAKLALDDFDDEEDQPRRGTLDGRRSPGSRSSRGVSSSTGRRKSSSRRSGKSRDDDEPKLQALAEDVSPQEKVDRTSSRLSADVV